MYGAGNEGRGGVFNDNHRGRVHALYTSAHSVKLEVKKSGQGRSPRYQDSKGNAKRYQNRIRYGGRKLQWEEKAKKKSCETPAGTRVVWEAV
jgi:hypothetical protein